MTVRDDVIKDCKELMSKEIFIADSLHGYFEFDFKGKDYLDISEHIIPLMNDIVELGLGADSYGAECIEVACAASETAGINKVALLLGVDKESLQNLLHWYDCSEPTIGIDRFAKEIKALESKRKSVGHS